MKHVTAVIGGPVRRRAFSQRAVWHQDEFLRGSSSSERPTTAASGAQAPQVKTALDGRSYLLPTMTLQRVPGSNAIAAAILTEGPLTHSRTRKTPIVLDLQLVSSDGSPHAQPIKKHELRAEIERLNELGFIPVGITNASEDIKQLAHKLYLPYFISTRMHSAANHQQQYDMEVPPTSAPAEPASPSANPTQEPTTTDTTNAASSVADKPAPMIVKSGVRSGQQIFAQHRSLIVLGNVNSGAEVLADGDIYVLGALKGRALAGIGGDVHARITCHSFDAELVSIAHHFTTCDELPASGDATRLLKKPTSISLRDDQLHFESTM